jgi:hypothetical protein
MVSLLERTFFVNKILPCTSDSCNTAPSISPANEMSALSYQKFQQSKFEDVAYFEPYYLKDFMATVAKK